MSAVSTKANPSLRIIFTSVRALELGVTALSAIALALAFPKTQLAWLAPAGAAGLFWAWQRLSWRRAFWLGWFGGFIFFAISFSWFSYTVGGYVGHFAPFVVIVPALLEGLAFALAAAFAVLAYARSRASLAPLAAAAAFTSFEWIRSIGILGAPFAQLGYTQVNSPLGVFGAYIGCYGVTFVICTIGAYVAFALRVKRNRELVITITAIVVVWAVCWLLWPARHAAAPAIRVAAIQGNITQSLKHELPVSVAVNRYIWLTRTSAGFSPQLIVWPETVITTTLNYDPTLVQKFAALAHSANATLIVGSNDFHGGHDYNSLYMFTPQGSLEGLYDKRQLVPFAEDFPGKSWLYWLPYVGKLNGDFGHGTVAGVYPGPLPFAPLICWESAFADLAHAQLRQGAKLLIISTDDAWFGDSAGPLQHAQIAQMRAIESGTWVVRAASTGISGIIAPDGRYTERSEMDTQAVVLGRVGQPPGSLFARIGPTPIAVAGIVLYMIVLGVSRRAEA
ncbi:MAG: apolipoprotein N-acyltransferase [Candidatus Baltobacteraceae bacterium]